MDFSYLETVFLEKFYEHGRSDAQTLSLKDNLAPNAIIGDIQKDIQAVAVHEAGHAAMAALILNETKLGHIKVELWDGRGQCDSRTVFHCGDIGEIKMILAGPVAQHILEDEEFDIQDCYFELIDEIDDYQRLDQFTKLSDSDYVKCYNRASKRLWGCDYDCIWETFTDTPKNRAMYQLWRDVYHAERIVNLKIRDVHALKAGGALTSGTIQSVDDLINSENLTDDEYLFKGRKPGTHLTPKAFTKNIKRLTGKVDDAQKAVNALLTELEAETRADLTKHWRLVESIAAELIKYTWVHFSADDIKYDSGDDATLVINFKYDDMVKSIAAKRYTPARCDKCQKWIFLSDSDEGTCYDCREEQGPAS